MIFDYFAEMDNSNREPDLKKVDEVTTRYHRRIVNGDKKDADDLRSQWSKQVIDVSLNEPAGAVWQMIASPTPDLSILPPYTFYLKFNFALAKPYISKDDNAFYIIDNPLLRDKVFRLPMVRPTGWKGNLYSAVWQLGHDKRDEEQMQRLFGEIRDTEEGKEKGHGGRLFFYPTFFAKTSLEVISPHDRERRVGKNPILFESVPIGAEGTFTLIYVPFDRVSEDEAETRKQVAEDLRLLTQGIRAMFRTYGFSAKRTSGFGIAEESLAEGVLTVRAAETAAPIVFGSPPPPSAQPLPKYLAAPGRLKPEYLNPDGTFRERGEAELKTMGKSARQEYEKAKKWWEREGKALTCQPPAGVSPPSPPQPQPRRWLKREFNSFTALVQKADEIAQVLQAGGGQ